MSILICKCGMWLKAPDPDQAGGLGRCPSCGRTIGPKGVVGDVEPEPPRSLFRRRPRRPSRALRGRPLTFIEAMLYPLTDGPGIGLLVVLPPFLAFMSIPVFDILPLFRSAPGGGFNALAILVIPLSLPLIVSFSMLFGYILLYFGRVLVNSSMGRDDHPRYPLWDWQTILDGVIRWGWAGIVGAGLGGLPALLYYQVCGRVDWIDRIVFVELLALGAGYAQMGLAAAILHDNVATANPVTIARAIYRIGWDYIWPSLATAVAITIGYVLADHVLNRIPDLTLAAFGLWGIWIYALYAGMVVMHILGYCYYRHGASLGWFHSQPKWGSWERPGRLYQNS